LRALYQRRWGQGGDGVLGTDSTQSLGSSENSISTVEFISFAGGAKPVYISASSHTCVVFDNGKAQCFGNNASGQLGIDSKTHKGRSPGDMANLDFIPFQSLVKAPSNVLVPTYLSASTSSFTVAFSGASFSVDEGGAATLTVAASAASTASFSMTCTLASGTATATTDFDATSKTVVFAAGETTASVSVGTVDDLLGEAAETFTATLSDLVDSTGGGSLSGTTVATVTIVDNDAFEAQLSGVTIEGNVAKIEVKRVPADRQGAFTATIDVTSAGAAGRRRRAEAGVMAGVSAETVTTNRLAPGVDTDRTAPLRPLAAAAAEFGINDAVATALLPLAGAGLNGDLVFSITGVSGLGATPSSAITVGSSATATMTTAAATATPSAAAPQASTIQFAASSFSGIEGQRMAVTLTRLPAGALGGTATVDVALGAADGLGDTATPHADYDASIRRVTFGDGESTRTIYVDIVADAEAESTEHFAIRLAALSSSTGQVTLGHPVSVTGYIEVARVSFASGVYTVPGGQGEALVDLVLSRAIGDPVSVSVVATSASASRTQVAQAVFAALATTTSAVVDLDALGLGSSGGSVALRLAGLATAATRDAEASQGTATLTVAGSGSDGSVKGWEIPLIVFGALATLALLLTVTYCWFSRRRGARGGAGSRGSASKTTAAVSDRPARSVAIDVAGSGHGGGDDTGYGSSVASSDGTDIGTSLGSSSDGSSSDGYSSYDF
jgi:hypothetical protein